MGLKRNWLPPANEVWGKVIFLHLFVILFTGGHAWLLPGGGVRGCSQGGACVVAPGGACVVAPGGACVGYNEIWRYDQ